MYRLLFTCPNFNKIEDILDENNIKYDWDSANRLIVAAEDVDLAVRLLEDNHIYPEII